MRCQSTNLGPPEVPPHWNSSNNSAHFSVIWLSVGCRRRCQTQATKARSSSLGVSTVGAIQLRGGGTPAQPLELHLSLLAKAEVTCAFGQVLQERRDEDLTATGLARDTGGKDNMLAGAAAACQWRGPLLRDVLDGCLIPCLAEQRDGSQ